MLPFVILKVYVKIGTRAFLVAVGLIIYRYEQSYDQGGGGFYGGGGRRHDRYTEIVCISDTCFVSHVVFFLISTKWIRWRGGGEVRCVNVPEHFILVFFFYECETKSSS
jgi:hypothetical protein